jgi:hypothetical protein
VPKRDSVIGVQKVTQFYYKKYEGETGAQPTEAVSSEVILI